MIQLEVWGNHALFSRPELKTERVSYDVPTPSAARGIVESIFYHPGLKWKISRIYILNPTRFVSIQRNEIKKTRSPVKPSVKPLKANHKIYIYPLLRASSSVPLYC